MARPQRPRAATSCGVAAVQTQTSPKGELPPAAPAAQSQASNYFNPSVSVIGNFLAVAGKNSVENLPNASDMRDYFAVAATPTEVYVVGEMGAILKR